MAKLTDEESKARHRMNYIKPVKINKAQDEFAEMVGLKNMDPLQAIGIAWPDNHNPSHKLHMVMKSPGVKIMIRKYQLKSVRIEATNLAYNTWKEICMDKKETGSARNKAAENLHNYFGFGKLTDDDDNAIPLEDMSPDELKEFIANTEKQLEDSKHDDGIVDAEFEAIDEEPQNIDTLFPKTSESSVDSSE